MSISRSDDPNPTEEAGGQGRDAINTWEVTILGRMSLGSHCSGRNQKSALTKGAGWRRWGFTRSPELTSDFPWGLLNGLLSVPQLMASIVSSNLQGHTNHVNTPRPPVPEALPAISPSQAAPPAASLPLIVGLLQTLKACLL